MSKSADNFKVDPLDYLGHKYDAYLAKMYTLALSNPTEYLKLRETVKETVKRTAVTAIYTEYYSVLTEGKTSTGTSIYGSKQYAPHYPQQKVNDFCIGASETLNQILDDLCEIIIPDSMNKIMGDKIGVNKVL
jgi:hypothetical protein